MKQIGLVNVDKLPGIAGVLYGSRRGGKRGVGSSCPEVATYVDEQAPGRMREIELPISSIVNLSLAVQLWLRRSETGRVRW